MSLSLPFREIWCVDFEYETASGERPAPLCTCGLEVRSGRQIKLWRDELLSLKRAPFDGDSVTVAYAAAAEASCFFQLDWPLPVNIIDLFAEHRVATNGIEPIAGNKLTGALAIRGLAHMDAGEKKEIQEAIGNGTWRGRYTPQEILDYCMSDCVALAALLPAMMPLNLPFALLRGCYGAAVARMERAGVPVDVSLYRRIVGNWEGLKQELIRDVDQSWHVYEDGHFRVARFEQQLTALGISRTWPRTETGFLALDDDTFLEQAARHPELPQLQTLRELRATLGRMRLIGLEIGPDGRNRCSLMPFQAITGRNLPSNAKFIFGPARWLRGLITPPTGWGLAYLDFASEEIAIAAALAGDEMLAEHYLTGDPYLRFAVTAGLAPADATKDHPARDASKSLFLGIGYGMQAASLAAKAGITLVEARELIRLHIETYRNFARWRMDTVDRALLTGHMTTAFDWRRRGATGARPTELMNWPIQSTGADLMRIVCIAATEAGIEVACPVHDAFLIVSPLDRLAQDMEYMREIMQRASEVVTGGLRIRVDAKVIRAGGRYMDERGRAMCEKIMGLLRRQEERKAA
jgi:DNA polymerase-1